MEKQANKFNIFDVEHFYGLLNDLEVIFDEKNEQLNQVLSDNTLDSIKREKINTLLFVVVGYDDAIKNIRERFVAFKKSPEIKKLNSNSVELVKAFSKKINKNLLESKKFIDRCAEFLNLDTTNDLT